jgi:hypothetical protein
MMALFVVLSHRVPPVGPRTQSQARQGLLTDSDVICNPKCESVRLSCLLTKPMPLLQPKPSVIPLTYVHTWIQSTGHVHFRASADAEFGFSKPD